MASLVKREGLEAHLLKDRKAQVTFSTVRIVERVQDRGLDSRRPERLPGSNRRAEDDWEKGIRPEWISKTRWKRSWTGS